MKLIDLTGKKFGKLTVVSRAENNRNGGAMWNCICECGNTTISNGNALRQGHSKSCGCTRNEKIKLVNYKHGMSNTRIFVIWQNMKYRCSNPNNYDYDIYGGRGISVCEEWKNDFMNFYNWAIKNGYSENLTIDRINPNGNYEPSNCRWVSQIEQANNRRNNHIVTYHNKTDTLDNMCRTLNINSKTIRQRMCQKNISFQNAVDNYAHTSEFKEYWKKN